MYVRRYECASDPAFVLTALSPSGSPATEDQLQMRHRILCEVWPRRSRAVSGAAVRPPVLTLRLLLHMQALDGMPQDEADKVCPEATSGWASLVTFSWISPLLRTGYKYVSSASSWSAMCVQHARSSESYPILFEVVRLCYPWLVTKKLHGSYTWLGQPHHLLLDQPPPAHRLQEGHGFMPVFCMLFRSSRAVPLLTARCMSRPGC